VSDSAGIRPWLAEQLELPTAWHVIPEQRMPETIARITVVIKHRRIEKLPEAPIGHLRHEVTLTVADPHTDVAAAEDALDEAVVELIGTLDGHPSISWSDAEKVAVNDTYFGWDLTLSVITNRTTTEEV
jgi:hypothetical protein